ncbi:LysM peptidoglycan-binding domain-containing protein [Arthrobacter sp. SDTb3-6]|uniref:LysM peptidoglycan-binding domain-containing protein n=1 Tax=Arthrobacter sp. SDTb3-6 TaxID=2713571 RepID=UPI00159E13EB|nr:hypothetical protein [Arthrobacter sp. SDTb3-6]NVM97502.1 hypothetical protein [Arthrobacter sp. SDTb3-6]
MKRQAAADAAMTAAVLLLGASLVFAGEALLRRRIRGQFPAAPLALDEVVGAAAAGIGIAVTTWWLAALACAFLAGLARLRGRSRLAQVADAWSPAFMRRLVAVVLGLNLLAAPMATAAPGTYPVDPRWQPGPVAAAPLHVAPAGPATRVAAAGKPPANRAPAVAAGKGPPVNPAWTPQAPVMDPGPLARAETRPSQRRESPVAGAGGKVVVRGGDTLWSIVAGALGPYATDLEVAQAWPDWYRANRSVIGNDPNVILPGQVLHAPAG